jgi:hypothetical protein
MAVATTVANTDNSQDQQFYKDAKHWAKIPRSVILRRMAADQPLTSRIFYACVLWSICGPHATDRVVRKDIEGFFERERGELVPANQKALMDLLKLPPGMKGEFSRKIRRLIRQRILSFDGEAFYLEPNPTPYRPSEGDPEVISIRNWNVAGIVVRTHNLPSDPDARIEAQNWLDEVNTGYNNELKGLRTRNRKLLRQGCLERGILISEKIEKTRTTTTAVNGSEPQPAAAAAAAVVVLPPPPEPTPEPLPDSPPKPPEPTLEEITHVRNALAEFGNATFATAELVITRSRQECPDATAEEVARSISETGKGFNRTVQRPIGVLVATVPKGFRGYRRPPPTPSLSPPVEPACKLCGDSGYLGNIVDEKHRCPCRSS